MDYEGLNQVIETSGLKKSYIAEQLGLSERVFFSRVKGETQFKLDEAVALCEILRMTKMQRERIFFTRKVK